MSLSSSIPSGTEEETSSSLQLIDVDCNLWHEDLQTFLRQTPGTATEEGNDKSGMANPWHSLQNDDTSQLVAALTPCSTLTESQKAVTTLQQYHDDSSTTIALRTTLGVHPYHVTNDDVTRLADTEAENIQACLQQLRKLYYDSEHHAKTWVAAVGECGLDQAPGFPPLEKQVPWFAAQIALAHEWQLPLFVHERLAFDETMRALADTTSVPVLIHCFTGTAAQLEAYLERGFYISLAGGFLAKRHDDPNADSVYQALGRLWHDSVLPDRLMLETDAPYMGFAGCRRRYLQKHEHAIAQHLTSKKRKRLQSSTYPNVPSSLEQVLDLVCDAIQQSGGDNDKDALRQQVAERTTANARRFFGFPE